MMNEFDPTRREYFNLSHLNRVESDIYEVTTFADMQISLMKFFTNEFNIPEDMIAEWYSSNEDVFPSAILFEQNIGLAREQAILSVIKIGLPLAENFKEDNNTFKQWTSLVASMAIDTGWAGHDIGECSKVLGVTAAPQGCSISGECPIKFTAYKLIKDAAKIDHESPDYLKPWVEQKIERTIAKVQVARDLKLIETESADHIVQSYLRRCISLRPISRLTLNN